MDTGEQGMQVEGECKGRMRSRETVDIRHVYSAIGYIYRERSCLREIEREVPSRASSRFLEFLIRGRAARMQGSRRGRGKREPMDGGRDGRDGRERGHGRLAGMDKQGDARRAARAPSASGTAAG